MNLRSTLLGFADTLLAADDPTEGVSVEVVREHGFQNAAVTPTGQRILIDEPVHFGGSGAAPDPAQYLLAAIGASLSVTLSAHAAMRSIVIDGITMSLSATIDGRAFFHPGGAGDAGLLEMTATLRVTSPEDEATFRALLADVLLATPVLQSLKHAPRITLHYNEDR